MGFFKSMRDLHQEATDIEKSMPPVKERMVAANARIYQATESMAEQTHALNQQATAASTGVEATATINAARSVGMVNFDPLLEIELTVMRDGLPPYPATLRQVVPQMELARLQSGTSVGVKVDPNDQTAIWMEMPLKIQ